MRTPSRQRVASLAALAVSSVLLLWAAPAGAVSIPYTVGLTDTTSSPGISVGKLFVQWPNGVTSDCSASVVDAPNQSTLATAGHCVFRPSRGGLASEVQFAPGYRGGESPFGTYFSRNIAVGGPWMLSGHSHFDFAFMVVGRDGKGRAVEDRVGGLPLAFNGLRNQTYRLLGYPGEPAPFEGSASWTCGSQWGGDRYDPDPDEQYGPPIMIAGCNMGHGSSGGPWLTAGGAVASVISTEVPRSPETLGGPYFGSDAAALFATVSNISTEPRCKKGKKGKKSAAAAKKKKCKRKGKK